MKRLTDDQKMKRHIWRLKFFGIMDLIFAVMAHMARFLTGYSEGKFMFWSGYATFVFFFVIFLGGAFIAFDLVSIIRILLAKVSGCQERIELLENQVSTLKGQGAESS